MSNLNLHSSTISEFHEQDLMVYYDLCKREQVKHFGSWIKSFNQLQIPEFDIKKDTIQDRTILRDKNWGTKRRWRNYMKKQGYNKTNTKMLMVDHNDLPEPLMHTLQKIEIKYPVFSLNIQPPGAVVPAHGFGRVERLATSSRNSDIGSKSAYCN